MLGVPEPTPDPSQEGIRQTAIRPTAARKQIPSLEGQGWLGLASALSSPRKKHYSFNPSLRSFGAITIWQYGFRFLFCA